MVFTKNETKDSDAVFVHLLNILCKLAQYYYINQMLFPTVQLIYLSKTTNY